MVEAGHGELQQAARIRHEFEAVILLGDSRIQKTRVGAEKSSQDGARARQLRKAARRMRAMEDIPSTKKSTTREMAQLVTACYASTRTQVGFGYPREKLGMAHVSVVPVLGRWGQADTWSSVASHSMQMARSSLNNVEVTEEINL